MDSAERAPSSALSSEQVQVAQAAGIIALGSVTSRVLGLVRVIVKSGLFGAGPEVSALDAAIRVPNTLNDLLAGGMISSALVPVLSDYASAERRGELWSLLGSLIGVASVLVCGLLVLGELFAPQLMWLMAGGLSRPTQTLSTELLRLVLPAILFLNLAGILTGALYALKRFGLPAFTATIFNAAVVIVALLLGRRWGVHSMVAGLVIGAVLQVALQLPGLRDARFRLSLNIHHAALGRIGRLYLPILIGLVVDKLLAEVLSYHLASYLGDSAISWMEYAAQIIQFPLGLVAAAISIATLPTLSQQATAEQVGPFRATLAQGLRLVLVLIIPATVGLFVLAGPLVGLVFEHGDFTTADTAAVTEALRYHLLGLIFAAVDWLLIFAFYARKDTLTPALVGVATTILYAAAALSLTWLGRLTLPLLILINSLKWAVHALIMLVLAWRRLGGLGGHGILSVTLRAGLLSGVMAVVAWRVTDGLVRIAPPGLSGELLVVGGAGCAGLATYLLLGSALRVEEIRLLRTAFLDGLRRLTALRRQTIMPPPEQAERE